MGQKKKQTVTNKAADQLENILWPTPTAATQRPQRSIFKGLPRYHWCSGNRGFFSVAAGS